MRIGIDFDNTIICYDEVFCNLAKASQLVASHFQGTKQQLREIIQAMPEGDTIWQRLQGKAYGEQIRDAQLFAGFKAFITACNTNTEIEIFIVSHKTEFGHFDENHIKLRDAARQWLHQQGFFNTETPYILEKNIFFESTREEKIARIKSLQCTHFIDDLIEVLDSPLFPDNVERVLFQPQQSVNDCHSDFVITPKTFSNWTDIKNAFFS